VAYFYNWSACRGAFNVFLVVKNQNTGYSSSFYFRLSDSSEKNNQILKTLENVLIL
jgi:hypothetical protein